MEAQLILGSDGARGLSYISLINWLPALLTLLLNYPEIPVGPWSLTLRMR